MYDAPPNWEDNMSEKSRFNVELPERLRGKFNSLERKLWFVDTLIAVCGIACGLVVAYLLLFMSDRFWDTPAAWRLTFTLAGGAVALHYAWFWAKHWILNRRDNRVLAAIVQRKHRRMGDRLMSAVELTSIDQRPEDVSEELCRAAIEQIDRESENISFNKAVSTRKSRIAFVLTVLVLGVLSLPMRFTGDASQNALQRAVPGSGAERYTFVQNGDLQVNGRDPEKGTKGTFYVPRGEMLQFTSQFAFADQQNGTPFWETLGGWWQQTHNAAERMDLYLGENKIGTDFANTFSSVLPDPSEAVLTHGKKTQQAQMIDGHVNYTLQAGTKPMKLALRVGDVRRYARIEPVARPALKSLNVSLSYPEYLHYPKAESLEVRGGVFSFLEGSTAVFRAEASRNLNSANIKVTHAVTDEITEQPGSVSGANLSTANLILDDISAIEVSWVDQYHIAGANTWKLGFDPIKDQPPHADSPDQAPVVAILRSESLSIPAFGEDDYGMEELKIYWECFNRGIDEKDGTPKPFKTGESILVQKASPGTHSLTQTWHFDPSDKALNIPDDTMVNVYVVAKDYYRTDRYVRSLPVKIYILTPEEHAQLIQENFDTKMAELDDIVRRQENLLEETKQLQEMSPEDQAKKSTEKELARQEQEQKDIAEKLKELAEEIGELGKEASKNKEIDPKTLAEMAKSMQKMKDLAAGEMSEAEQSLGEAQQSAQPSQPSQPSKPKDKKEKIDKAAKKEQEALDKLKEMQKESADTTQDMYENTLVLRLRKLGEYEEKLDKELGTKLESEAGGSFSDLPEHLQTFLNNRANDQHRNATKANDLQGEIKRFAESTLKENFGDVAKEMDAARPPEKLDENAQKLRLNQSLTARMGAKKLGEDFMRWADKLDPPKDGDGGGEGEGGKSDDPNEEMLERMKELLRLRQAEMDLREQTGELEGDREKRAAKQFEEGARNLAFRQFELLRDLQLEMDARTNLGKGEFLDIAREDMGRAGDQLDKPETGKKATDAETDAINKLEQEIAGLMKKSQSSAAQGEMTPEQMEMMMMMMQMMGMQPGQKPGPGQGDSPGMSTAGGNTNKLNQNTPGNVNGGNGPDRTVRKVAGRADAMPKEFQGVLQGYSKGVERLNK
ncbi:MAG: hypothetical protein H8E27_01540 [Verrucomicrobia subdivision 3 bacterium]|nr:hypothetical protein [Limisphaerales bacterium]